jgi:ribosomal protein L4
MALRVVLSDKLNSGNLIVLEDGSFSSVSRLSADQDKSLRTAVAQGG